MSKTPLRCMCGDSECPSCGSTLGVLRRLRDEIGEKITNAIEQQISEWDYAECERDTWYVREVAHTEDANLIDIEIRRLEKESKS